MANAWRRRTFTTKGSDPTVVVVWQNGTVKVTEFQNVYRVEIDDAAAATSLGNDFALNLVEVLATDLHKALESAFASEEIVNQMMTEDLDTPDTYRH